MDIQVCTFRGFRWGSRFQRIRGQSLDWPKPESSKQQIQGRTKTHKGGAKTQL